MGAREDILDAVAAICTRIVSRMCANAADHHGTVYNDLQRVAPGRYRMSQGQ